MTELGGDIWTLKLKGHASSRSEGPMAVIFLLSYIRPMPKQQQRICLSLQLKIAELEAQTHDDPK